MCWILLQFNGSRGDHMSHNPTYLQVYNKIKQMIQEGGYSVGTFLPSESELEEMFQVSRTTIRKAVKMLSEDGIVTVRQGSGTIINGNRITQNYNKVNSVTESLRRKGYTVTTGSMMIDILPASVTLAKELEIPINEKVARVQRVQYANGTAVAIMINYIPYCLVKGIEQYQNQFVGLYQFMEETYHIEIEYTHDKIYAKAADFMEAQALHVEPKEALLVVHRICYANKKPICVDHVCVVGSQYEVEIQGRGRSK